MLDTIQISVPEVCLPVLDKHLVIHSPEASWQVNRGLYRNLRVRYNQKGHASILGSLSAFLLRSNMYTLNAAQVSDAVDLLEEIFGLNPDTCTIRRLDIAATVEMPRPCSQYLGILTTKSRSQRAEYHAETVMFRNVSRSLVFYDKGKKEKLSDNFLRIELQLRKNDLKQWQYTLGDLRHKQTMEALADYWYQHFLSVGKQARPSLMINDGLKAKELRLMLAALGLEAAGGITSLMADVDARYTCRKKRYELNQELRKISGIRRPGDQQELLEELDLAAQKVMEYWIGRDVQLRESGDNLIRVV